MYVLIIMGSLLGSPIPVAVGSFDNLEGCYATLKEYQYEKPFMLGECLTEEELFGTSFFIEIEMKNKE